MKGRITLTIQVFGTKKCKETRKAELFFKERRIKFQFIDILEKSPSSGEWQAIFRYIPPEELLDRNGRRYKARKLHHMAIDPKEELTEDPLLMKTPVVRSDMGITAGYNPDIWKKWID